MSTSWVDPRHDGAGTWRHTRDHSGGLLDLAVALIACVLAGVVFVGLLVAGRAAMCNVYTEPDGSSSLSYCPGYTGSGVE